MNLKLESRAFTEAFVQFVAKSLYADRLTHVDSPVGYKDRQGRWYAADSERAPCCEHIRTPSAAYPLSLYRHCHTRRHLVALVRKVLSEGLQNRSHAEFVCARVLEDVGMQTAHPRTPKDLRVLETRCLLGSL